MIKNKGKKYDKKNVCPPQCFQFGNFKQTKFAEQYDKKPIKSDEPV